MRLNITVTALAGALLITAIKIIFPVKTQAITLSSQTQAWGDSLNAWQVIQELGTNLNGTLDKFTFRVSTNVSNSNQFNFTAKNSKIYDKTTNTQVAAGCVTSISDPLNGLTFNTSGVPNGYEDVTIDFSCNNYSFINGHRYLIKVTGANHFAIIYFSATAYGSSSNDYFTGGGARYANGNVYDYYHNSGSCDPLSYIWNDSTTAPSSGCYIWTSKKDDLYFTLTNTALPPKTPVIFIPGIGGSELQVAQDIIWLKDNGHGGTYSHSYPAGEKVWVNQTEAAKLGDDDYFDILRLKSDGVTPEASLNLTGNLNSFGYPDIDSFFQGLGYTKGVDYFVFNYDWRFDVRSTTPNLDSLIEQAKQTSGQTKVNIVAHSLGGLVARNYIADSTRAAKINKLIELGVPHLGSVDILKTLMYGIALKQRVWGVIPLGIEASEIRDVSQNLPAIFQLSISQKYFNFYNNSDQNHLYPFRDDRDIDNNSVTGSLDYSQTKTLLQNLNLNQTVFNLAESFHNLIDPSLTQANGVKLYEIVGSSQPTLGQIRETWWVTWPINILPKRDEIYINGDDTVPLYSASLRSDSLDYSGGAKIYYVDQKHGDLPGASGLAMQTVQKILAEDNTLLENQKITLEGSQISVDQNTSIDLYDDLGNHTGLDANGNPETNIANTFYDSLDDTKHVFVKKSSKKVTVKVKSSKTTKARLKIRHYSQDSVDKTTLYNDLPLTNTSILTFQLDPTTTILPVISLDGTIASPSASIEGVGVLDSTPPTTTVITSGTDSITVSLNSTDSDSGVLQTQYSLDNGTTVQVYTAPFSISTPGTYTLQFFSTDNVGNQEAPQTSSFTVSSTQTSGDTSTTPSSSSTVLPFSSTSILSSSNPIGGLNDPDSHIGGNDIGNFSIRINPEILGAQTFKAPDHPKSSLTSEQILEGIIKTGIVITVIMIITFITTLSGAPFPKKTGD